ncbi:MAG TPA: hypothetical protein VHZ55_03785 [Bryobacteraceae bacterium]|nr:hypothetical protein [Bryobacteraceae bacterium]
MSAAAISAPTPLFAEGSEFWKQLADECKREVEVINSVVSEKGLSSDHYVQCTTGSELRMCKSANPSTTVKLIIGFYSWGPMLSLAITGHQSDHWDFFPEECEMPIATDLDGSIVAIFDEGRSFSPRELAAYLTQAFRRCFPGVCLCR